MKEKIEKDDDVYTIKEFIAQCKGGLFIDYDGFGEYAKNGYKYDETWVKPSDVIEKGYKPPKRYTHIVWYNR